MLLRASGRTYDKTYDLRVVTGAPEVGDGVRHGALLVGFAEAVLGEDDRALTRARDALMAALGSDRLVDAAGVVGLFNAIDRVADATGIPLEAEKAEASADFRTALGFDRFDVSARA